jgi:hypothetical protein
MRNKATDELLRAQAQRKLFTHSDEEILALLRAEGIEKPRDLVDKTHEALRAANRHDLDVQTASLLYPTTGAQSLEEVVSKVRKSLRTAAIPPIDLSAPRPLNLNLEDRLNIMRTQAMQFAYPAPSVPFIVAGKRYEPKDISHFNGQALTFVWDERAAEQEVLHAVTSADELREYLQSYMATDTSLHDTTAQQVRAQAQGGVESRADAATAGAVAYSHLPNPAQAVFWEHANFAGASLTLESGHAYPDLTEIGTGALWWWQSWNDRISSVQTQHKTVELCWNTIDPYLTGPTFVLPYNQNISYIGNYWNDQTSAIMHHSW